MADLTRADVQHAVNDALHGVQNDLSRMSHIIDGMNRVGQDVKSVAHQLTNLEQTVNRIQNTLANAPGRSGDPAIMQLQQDIADLKTRFTAVEKFARDMSDYMQARKHTDEEDRQYRTA